MAGHSRPKDGFAFASPLTRPSTSCFLRLSKGRRGCPAQGRASRTEVARSYRLPSVPEDDGLVLGLRAEFAARFARAAACLARRPRLELAPTAVTQITHHGAWRGGRVVECTALEMRHRCKPIGGSNPSLSAIIKRLRESPVESGPTARRELLVWPLGSPQPSRQAEFFDGGGPCR